MRCITKCLTTHVYTTYISSTQASVYTAKLSQSLSFHTTSVYKGKAFLGCSAILLQHVSKQLVFAQSGNCFSLNMGPRAIDMPTEISQRESRAKVGRRGTACRMLLDTVMVADVALRPQNEDARLVGKL